MFTTERFELMELAVENGGVTLNDGKEIYSSKGNASRVFSELEKYNILEKKKAPSHCRARVVYTPTEICEIVTQSEQSKQNPK